MDNNKGIEIVRGLYGEYYIRRRNSEGRYEYFAGYDEMGGAVWDSFSVDYDIDKDSVEDIARDLRAAE